MKIGDKINTPNGTGVIVGFKISEPVKEFA